MRGTLWLKFLLPPVLLLLLLAALCTGDGLAPVVDAIASADLGRQVTVGQVRLGLGRTLVLTATGIRIADPGGFGPNTPALAAIGRLRLLVDVPATLGRHGLVFSGVALDHPVITLSARPDGRANTPWNAGSGIAPGWVASPGTLSIADGIVHVIVPSLQADLTLSVQMPAGGKMVGVVQGSFANAPVTGQFTGGDFAALRDPARPYPVTLSLSNGGTQVSLAGTLNDPEHLAGAHLRLSLSGENMADLAPLTGMPLPATLPYHLTGALDDTNDRVVFGNFSGAVGATDLAGTISDAPGPERRQITAELSSQRLDLTDLAGFLGGVPGRRTTPGLSAAARARIIAANAGAHLLPGQAFSLPELDAVDVDLRYQAAHILNRNLPFDGLTLHLIVADGHVTVDPLDFAVGGGTLAGRLDLAPGPNGMQARAQADLRDLPLSRLLAATHAFAGAGTLRGALDIEGSGDSVAGILTHGDGHAVLLMQHGAYSSARMGDIANLQMGDVVLSGLGIPVRTEIQCMVSDFTLNHGIVQARTFLLATPKANILGTGTADLATETLDFGLKTEATHFSVGTLTTPLHLGGTLKNPSLRPAAIPLAENVGQAVELGMLFPPLAIVPTIRLGLGDKNACADTIAALAAGHPQNPK